MSFIDRLNLDVKPRNTEVIEELKNSNDPVVIYGKGEVAHEIVKILSRNGIQTNKMFVDDEYLSPPSPPPPTHSTINQEKTCQFTMRQENAGEIPICGFKEIEPDLPHYNVILGHKDAILSYPFVGKLTLAKSVKCLYWSYPAIEEIDPTFITEHQDAFEKLYNGLSDKLSKDTFVAYLQAKISQDIKYLQPVFKGSQYFPNDDFLKLTKNEVFFDCGAYIGDSIAWFLNASNGLYQHIYACEPNIDNLKKLVDYVKDQRLTNIDIINKGVSNITGRLSFQMEANASRIAENSLDYIDVDTIDNIVSGNPVSYIKMDIEGSELLALQGAEQTIIKFKPTLGICVYHKRRDLIDIPAYIKKLAPEYKFYLRHHSQFLFETVLYAIAR
jgi:FkbM family methyltransferase